VYGVVERHFSGQSRQDLVLSPSLRIHVPASDHVEYLHRLLLESLGLSTMKSRVSKIPASPAFLFPAFLHAEGTLYHRPLTARKGLQRRDGS